MNNTNLNNQTKKSAKKTKTTHLAIAALFVAIALAVKPFEIYILPVARFNFVGIPIIMSGIVLGPVWGAAVGFIADIVSFLFMDKSGMAINPILTLANVALGAIPGLIFLKKNSNNKKFKYNLLNIGCYVVLLLMGILLLSAEGTMIYKDGILQILSPSTGDFSPVSWVVVGLVALTFLAYSIAVIFMVTKNKDNDPSKQIMPKLLFAVTASMIIGDILISGLGLGIQYGWPLGLMLTVRIVKAFFAIPIYAVLCFVINKATSRFKI